MHGGYLIYGSNAYSSSTTRSLPYRELCEKKTLVHPFSDTQGNTSFNILLCLHLHLVLNSSVYKRTSTKIVATLIFLIKRMVKVNRVHVLGFLPFCKSLCLMFTSCNSVCATNLTIFQRHTLLKVCIATND